MQDLTDTLRDWPYEAGSTIRKVTAEDGRTVLQVRTPLGIEQYEMDGRPDGAQPYGRESVLEHAEALLIQHVAEHGSAESFEIEPPLAAELQQEGLLYYYRYLVCFQIGDYDIVVRDTYRNMKTFDLIRDHCKDADAVTSSEQYRPYLLRMNAAARALIAVGLTKYSLARGIIHKAVRTIAELDPVPSPTFEYERRRSLSILRGMIKAIPEARVPSPEETLRRELRRAVEAENYERAAQLRDRLKELASGHPQSTSPASESPN